jgi:hypothetical protein
MVKENGFITVEIFDILIKEVKVTDKVSLSFSDLKLNMAQTQDLVALRKSGAAVDLVVRQRELPLFEEDPKG